MQTHWPDPGHDLHRRFIVHGVAKASCTIIRERSVFIQGWRWLDTSGEGDFVAELNPTRS